VVGTSKNLYIKIESKIVKNQYKNNFRKGAVYIFVEIVILSSKKT
jgi:hypothetical protein